MKKLFSEDDFARIKAKVKEAESQISGEIVPVIVDRCSDYSIAVYRSTLVGILASFVAIVLIDRFIPGIAIYDPLWYFLFVLAGGTFTALLSSFISPLKRFFVGEQILDETIQQHAELYFTKEEVFNTKQRTGILIFIALWERRIVIKADTGIDKVVKQETWDDLVSIIIKGIKENKITDGILSAIEMCGQILLENGFVVSSDDKNELSDDLRVGGK